MSFTGFPDSSTEDGASSVNKIKLNTNKRQKEKLLLAAANRKVNSQNNMGNGKQWTCKTHTFLGQKYC